MKKETMERAMLDLRADKVELQRQIMILHARNERQQMLIEYLNGVIQLHSSL